MIRHFIQGRKYTDELPNVICNVNATVEGAAECLLNMSDPVVAQINVYELSDIPNCWPRYIRIGNDLYADHPDILTVSAIGGITGQRVSWRFRPDLIPNSLDKIYSIEIELSDVEDDGTAETAKAVIQIVVNTSADVV